MPIRIFRSRLALQALQRAKGIEPSYAVWKAPTSSNVWIRGCQLMNAVVVDKLETPYSRGSDSNP